MNEQTPETPVTAEDYAQQRIAIDASSRVPILCFFAGAIFWLVVGSLLALIASIKMHWPEFLGDVSWLTFGRVRPAHLNMVAYGWAAQAGVGVLLWLMARLANMPLQFPRLLVSAAVIWNIGTLLGLISILSGNHTSVEWLEFPPAVPPFFTAAFALAAVSALATFRLRRQHHVYVSQWYLIAAIFWFPWLYLVSNLLLVYVPMTGVTQAMVNWWYGHNALGLYFTPVGLAAAYYLIPKVLGRPIYSYYMSIVGFWALAIFYNWAGAHHLIGGPVPAWLITVSAVGSMMMFIPVGTVAINHHMTMVGRFRMLRYSPTLRFVVLGAMAYTAVSSQGALQSLRTVNEVVHFTHYTIAHAHLGLYGFFSFIMFGSLYYIVPRLTDWEWASAGLIRTHFWGVTVGLAVYFISLTWMGWFQGHMMNDPEVPFMDIVAYSLPYLRVRTWAGVLMTVGHLAFAALFVMNLMRWGERRQGPTLFRERGEEETASAGATA